MIKKYITSLFVVLLSCNAIAQSKKELEKQAQLKSLIWGEDDSYASAMDTPEKWTNESGVYLVKSVKYFLVCL